MHAIILGGMVIFESEEPHFYTGDLSNSQEIIAWLKEFVDDMDAVKEEEEEEASGEETELDGIEG